MLAAVSEKKIRSHTIKYDIQNPGIFFLTNHFLLYSPLQSKTFLRKNILVQVKKI